MLHRVFRSRDRGQILIASAILTPVLLGMAALAVDLGSYASERRSLQNAADAIALAAAQDLPDATNAQATAQTWAAKYNLQWSQVTFTMTPQGAGNPNPKVTIDISRTHQFALIQVLGIGSRHIGAHAAAIKTSPGGVGGLSPWSVTQAALQSAPFGQSVTLKYDANNPTTGNFGALALDGTGSATYLTTEENGSTSVVCAQGVTNCTTISPECSGSSCPTQTGNMVGKTNDGIDYLLANTDPSCATFSQVVTGPVNGTYQINPQCNPWLADSKPSYHLIIVPIINSLCNGSCSVTVVGFSLFWLNGFGGGGCTGNNCEVTGTFINANLSVNALTGVYDPNSSIHFTRLSE